MINEIERYSAYASRLMRLSLNKLRRDGMAAFLQACSRKALGVLHGRDGSLDREFDRDLGTDTAGIVPVWKMDVDGVAKEQGNRYQASDPHVFRELITELPVDPKDFTFIDLGSGKGRALLLASMAGFRTAIGVEFSKTLFDISNQNILLYSRNFPERPPVECVLQDATKFQFSDMDFIAYLYNPFGEAALRTVIENILNTHMKYKRDIYVIYFNNEHDLLFSQNEGFQRIKQMQNATIYKCRLTRDRMITSDNKPN